MSGLKTVITKKESTLCWFEDTRPDIGFCTNKMQKYAESTLYQYNLASTSVPIIEKYEAEVF
jgi:hypothetical protein